jgi:hypothetical protein
MAGQTSPEPSSSRPTILTNQFTGCTGGTNTPSSFTAEGLKLPTLMQETWTLTDGSRRRYVIRRAIVEATGDVVIDAPGFDHAAANVVVCHTTHEGANIETWGILTPRGGH